MSQSLIALDTNHIKGYVFSTNKLKEIRGASSILDHLNRVQTVTLAESAIFGATRIYANGGSALFLIDSDKAEALGKAVQKLYHEKTGGGASITYAIQPIPDYGRQDVMTAKQLNGNVTMLQVLKLLRLRLRLAKDSQQTSRSPEEHFEAEEYIVAPSHVLLCTCNSCGLAYAEGTWRDLDDPDDPDGRYCRVCLGKREEDRAIKIMLATARKNPLSDQTLWGRILQTLTKPGPSGIPAYALPVAPKRPKDFNAFRDFSQRKEYLGLIYADANGMGKAIETLETLEEIQRFASHVDNAVFDAMGDAIKTHLPLQRGMFPFDILLIGGDDIVMVAPAEKALQVACTLTERFHALTDQKYTLSVGVVLAPVTYPFHLQQLMVDDIIKAAKKSGSEKNTSGKSLQEQSRINFVVVTGNTSLSYSHLSANLYREKKGHPYSEKFYATMRPYTLSQLTWLLEQLKAGNEQRLGRTKLHQMREAILKLNCTTTILEALMLLHNWREQERDFMKQMVTQFDTRLTAQQEQRGTLFPWYLNGSESSEKEIIYGTPLLDFIELYDFVSS